MLALGCGDDDGPEDASMADGSDPADAIGSDGTTTPGCGDGVVDRSGEEVCDDGNNVDGDGCSADCLSDETCGNGVRDDAAGERCDDGNTDDGDACRGDCGSDYTCGNGVVDTVATGGSVDEVCDDGNTANGDGCSAACDSDESCGNSIVDLGAGEVCDDGNMDDGDECSADCRTSLLCGNGDLDGAEECDDGNTDPGDGCNGSCQVERCGNGRVDAGETCDDGNGDDADGCTSDCEYTCSDDAGCADADFCNGDETCSDPGTTDSRCNAGTPLMDGDACGSGLICDGGSCVVAACGDGFTSGAEECDDMNGVSGDGCENDCTFTCSGDGDCSDGNACTGTETCSDPGSVASRCNPGTPLSDGDPCGGGNICNGGTCASPGCGDGIPTGSEDCDDGNSVDGDGCDNDCTWTCTRNRDCRDSDVCDGAETCSNPSSLMSRCNAGTPPADGTSCGSMRICVMGACVMQRCGDGLVTGSEECDDRNTTPGDGCENDCTFTCSGDADCSDGNLCNGAETCTSPGTASSTCNGGTAPPTGTLCDADGSAATRDICIMSTETCARSVCGDGYTDPGTSPPEQCDDGNLMGGDGCSPSCMITMPTPPTAFRIITMRLISPHIIASIPFGGCQDITDDCARVFGGCVEDGVNTQIQTALNPPSAGGDYSLHLVSLFDPLEPAMSMTPIELHTDSTCTEGTPDACVEAMPSMPSTGDALNTSVGTCYMPNPAEVNVRAGTPAMYSPTANTPSGPCFEASFASLSVDLSGIVVPLTEVVVSGTYSGGPPPNNIVSGIITGFLSSDDAVMVTLPDTIPILGGNPLYNFLQAGNTPHMGENDSCNRSGGTHEDDRDTDSSGTTGFRFFLNFTAEVVDWTAS